MIDPEMYTWLCAALEVIYRDGPDADLATLEHEPWMTSPQARAHALAFVERLTESALSRALTFTGSY